MSDYTKTIEKQNEELKERLAEAEPWVPCWAQDEYGDWHYKSSYKHYGCIRNAAKKVYVLSSLEVNIGESFFSTLEEAKQYLEALVKR